MADALTELLREGARRLLAAAIEAEVEVFLSRFHDEKTASGRRRVVRDGHLPEWSIQTEMGPVAVSVPRVRGRAEKIRFALAISPPYVRCTRTLAAPLPRLCLQGVSTGDFREALTGLGCRNPLELDHVAVGGGVTGSAEKCRSGKWGARSRPTPSILIHCWPCRTKSSNCPLRARIKALTGAPSRCFVQAEVAAA